MKWIIALITLSGVCKGITDALGFPKEADAYSGWWSAGQNYGWAESFPWYIEPAAFIVVDAWHFFDAVRILALCVAVWVALRDRHGYTLEKPEGSPAMIWRRRAHPWWWLLVFWGVHQTAYMVSTAIVKGVG